MSLVAQKLEHAGATEIREQRSAKKRQCLNEGYDILTKANEYSAVVIPRCGPASPFKGHLSTKSNAFCLDSSRSLTNQYLIRDHMVFHYNRILSAKAAVDCSVPKSRLASIKFADQQRREKLKKKIDKCEEKMMCVCETVPHCSRHIGRLLPWCFRKFVTYCQTEMKQTDDMQGFYDSSNSKGTLQLPTELCSVQSLQQHSIVETEKDGLFTTEYISSALCPHGEHGLVHSSTVKYAKKRPWNTSYSSASTSKALRKSFGLPCSHFQRCQRNNFKACSWDLLERHSEFFTKIRKPFTPRTLISDAQSALSEYRYYTPARRKKKKHRKHRVEAQTQTEVISFPCAHRMSATKVTTEQQKIAVKAEDRRCTVDELKRGRDAFPCSIRRKTSISQKSSIRSTVETEDEELLYLTFIEDVTNDILKLGLFSDRVLEELFECHIEEHRNHLDEAKMRHMLDMLKTELCCSLDSEAEQSHAGQEASDSLDLEDLDTTEKLKFTSKGCRPRKATESEEFFGTMDLTLKEPNRCGSPFCRGMSRETQSTEESLEDMTGTINTGTESDSSTQSEEHTDNSPACEAALNLIACDSDSGVNKALDDLEESFAESLRISHDCPY